MAKLVSVWEEIGYDEETQRQLYINVQKRLDTVIDEVIEEGMKCRQKIINNVASYEASVNSMSAQLGQSLAAEVCDCKRD